ncbi:MAG TPA: diphthamide biosynthesis enzyme Dph2 [Candidatus Acidoferrales bacterium]|nr:diphthamide biosynthesis enzyme Dph2 [Candidatus Acidoferrales bacterium]
MYQLEEARIVEEIRKRGARRIMLQMPEGLKPVGFQLAKLIEKEAGVEVFVSGDPCYGACDLALYPKKHVEADLLIHLGHAEIPGEFPDENVFFVEARSNASIDVPMMQAVNMLESEHSIGLASNIQHIHQLPRAKEILEEHEKEVLIGRPSGWLKYPGQVLGCDYGSVRAIGEKADAIVVLSGGDFHALGIPLATGKRTIVVDPFQQIAKDMTETCKTLLRKRWANIEKFKVAKRIGIIVGLKSSQMNIALARRLKSLLEQNGQLTILISASEVIPETLESFTDLEAYVEISCPRISTDDQERYRKPVLNPEEVMIALGKKSWDQYTKGMTLEEWH